MLFAAKCVRKVFIAKAKILNTTSTLCIRHIMDLLHYVQTQLIFFIVVHISGEEKTSTTLYTRNFSLASQVGKQGEWGREREESDVFKNK